MSILLVAIVLLVIYYLVNFLLKFKRLNEQLSFCVRPPTGKFFFGHALEFQTTSSIIPKIRKFQLEYGNLLRLDAGSCFPFVVIADLKLLEFLLTSNKLIEKSPDYRFLEPWLGKGLLTSSGQQWFTMRKIITPAFHFQILEQFLHVFETSSKILIEKLGNTDGKPFDVCPYITAYSLDVICETAMGTTINAQLNEESLYVKKVKEIVQIFALRGFDPIKQIDFLYKFTRDYWRERSAVKIVHDYTRSVIKRRRALSKTDTNDADDEDEFGRKKKLALLDLLLNCSVNGRQITDEEIRQEVDTFMFAGHDTTATAVNFMLYCLSENPSVQDTVVEELREIFAEDKFRPVSWSDLQKMKYLEMTVKESLRLYPPAAMFARRVLESERFYGGTLPAEVPLVVFSYGLHRRADLYPDPEKFDPERFTTENQAKRNPFAYLPFSAGPRNCIGQRFAMIEMKATIANILRRFRVLPVPEHKIELSFETVLKSLNGIFVKMVPREF